MKNMNEVDTIAPLAPLSSQPAHTLDVIAHEKTKNRVVAFWGLVLYCLDFGSNAYLAGQLFETCDYIFRGLSVTFLFLPNIAAFLLVTQPIMRIKVLFGIRGYTLYHGFQSILHGCPDSMTEFKSVRYLQLYESFPQLFLALYILFAKGPTNSDYWIILILSIFTSYISILVNLNEARVVMINPHAPYTLVLWAIISITNGVSLNILTWTVCMLTFKYYTLAPLTLWHLGNILLNVYRITNTASTQSFKIEKNCFSMWRQWSSIMEARRQNSSVDGKPFFSILKRFDHDPASLRIKVRRYIKLFHILLYVPLMGVIYVLTSAEFIHLTYVPLVSNTTLCNSCDRVCPLFTGVEEIRTLIHVVLGLTLISCIEVLVELVAIQWTPFGIIINHQYLMEQKNEEEKKERKNENDDQKTALTID